MLVREYGMFTPAGDEAVEILVTMAEAALLLGAPVPDYWLLLALQELATQPGFAEATDTMVREAAYAALYGERVL
jgi:hypothetical protein